MGTSLHTFIDIFDLKFENDGEESKLNKIVIPIIQRDYAQGRDSSDVNRIRKRFLDTLYHAITTSPVTLDFVYGDIDSNGIMTPLDGQQRLTTLFLLHWYAAKKENIDVSEYEILNKFSYETRYSTRDFCTMLINFTPAFVDKISDEIKDRSWFPLQWEKDPSISSMLVMLDAIQEKFSNIEDIWSKLKNGAITFYFLPIKDMGLTDELYIKMNSRGKQLTLFEHFKAELEHNLREINNDKAIEIMRKIDCEWTDLLWQYRGENNIIDDEFLRYFQFVCDIICYKNNDTPQEKDRDPFVLLEEYYSNDLKNANDNIELLIQFFDCWCELNKNETPSEFMCRFISQTHETEKIIGESTETRSLDLFNDCLKYYGTFKGEKNRAFSLNRIVLLYAFITYLLNKDVITEKQFIRRIRIVNNLVQNSADELSDSERRSGGNRMPAILRQIDSIIIKGVIDENIEKNFNAYQLNEERQKIEYVNNHSDISDTLFKLEDHPLLHGQIGIIGLENISYCNRFYSLFDCNRDYVDRALLTVGDYFQQEKNRWRYQFGTAANSKSWDTLFHKSANVGFERTKEVLVKLLSHDEKFSDKTLLQIINLYLQKSENENLYEWKYYYIKYDECRPNTYGKYRWDNMKDNPYVFCVMCTGAKPSSSSYNPFLKKVDAVNLSKDDYGLYIIKGDKRISCENDRYAVYSIEDKMLVSELKISQNENGIDTEDRIKKFEKNYKTII